MGEIEAGIDELVAGRGSLFLVTGEPGIGKTRFADEAGRRAQARGVSIHWGRAWEAGGAPSYWLLVQALRTIARDAPALASLVTPSGTPVERFQLFEAVDGLLRAAGDVPRLVLLDDLHAADPSSLELLHFIVRDLRSRSLMVIATYREAEARLLPEVRPLLARISREASILPLSPLDRSDVAEFVAQSTGREASPERVEAIFLETEGNPLFIRELLQLQGSRTSCAEGIREVVRSRLSLIDRESRAALEAAAVLGREFAVGPLCSVAGISEPEARGLIEPAAHAKIVEALEEPPRWRFTHVLLRQGLYDDLPAERRAALHARAAAHLGQQAGRPAPAEIAHHLRHAIPAVSAVEAARAALRAAAHGMSLLAFEDALAFYKSAEELLESVPGEEPRLFEAVLGAGLALMRMAEVDRGQLECQRAADLARMVGDGEAFARAVLAGGYEHVPFSHDLQRIAQLEEALGLLPPGDGPLRAQCMAHLAGARDPEPLSAPLVQLARDAVAMARRSGEPDALLSTLSAAAFACAVYADPAERQLIYQETIRIALAAGDKRVALRAHGFLVGAFWAQGDAIGGRPHMVTVDALVREFRHGRFQWLASILHATAALFEGRFDEAGRLFAEAEVDLKADQARGALMAAAPISIACVTERYDDLAGLESRARARFGAIGHAVGSCIGEMLIAQLYGRAGDRERAARQLAACAQHPLFAAIEEQAWLAMLTDACHLVGDLKLADRVYRALVVRSGQFVFLGPLTACVDLPYVRHLGLLAETLGRLDEAVAHLEDAEARAARAGMRAHLARLRYELARTYLARGRAADRELAAERLVRARALATELGQTGLLGRIAELEAPSPRGATPAARPAPRFSLCQEGDFWSVAWQDQVVRLRDSRGLAILAQLVEHPGQELHVLQLASAHDEPHDAGDAGSLLDDKAVQRYRRRLLDLREELSEAEIGRDTARTEKAEAEIEFLTGELARAVGLGGRDRRTGQAAERARTAVQKRLREAVKRIESEIPELGLHLEQTIRTGVFCGYLPEGRRR
jgi:hypothetical protein